MNLKLVLILLGLLRMTLTVILPDKARSKLLTFNAYYYLLLLLLSGNNNHKVTTDAHGAAFCRPFSRSKDVLFCCRAIDLPCHSLVPEPRSEGGSWPQVQPRYRQLQVQVHVVKQLAQVQVQVPSPQVQVELQVQVSETSGT